MNKSKIEWTEKTWNPSSGCTKISEGCQNCYAEVMARRLQAMGVKGYENGFEFSLVEERLNHPLKVKKPTKFFVNSMSDLFHEEMPFSYIDKIMSVIKQTPHHIYQVLTKRDTRMLEYFSKNDVPKNIWLGVTVENRNYLSRLDSLRKINAEIRFVSMEPLLGNFGDINFSNIHWVIVGGESGPKARVMNIDWVLNIKEQCVKQHIAFFFKQWGTWGADGTKRNKKVNGRLLDGRIWEQYPELSVKY